MTSFEIERVPFDKAAVAVWAPANPRNVNWPIVYLLDGVENSPGVTDAYVGESLNAAARIRQHLESVDKQSLRRARIIFDPKFNKSVCLDLESYLIRLLAGDGGFSVLNRNDGITDADYYDRAAYRATFREVFEALRSDGVFTRSIPEIENSDLFKLSPFKALSQDQAIAVEDILEGLFEDLEAGRRSTIVIQGDPGTGKTVVAIFLLKLLTDIGSTPAGEDVDSDSLFSEFFVDGYRQLLDGLRIGFVVPQQSLRRSIQKVFRKTPGLDESMVLTPFDVGASAHDFDLLVVDEAHRLNQRANQPSGVQNKKFRTITEQLYGRDDLTKTQLDWIVTKSRHQLFLMDAGQSVRPADLPRATLDQLVDKARAAGRHYPLLSQMRVSAGSDYVGYVRGMLTGEPPPASARSFGDYEFRLFDDVRDMAGAIRERDAEFGLSRLVAGFAWEWRSKTARDAYDIVIGDAQFRWNSAETDWIASPKATAEVGSIHTVQGYDLNYAGVIIGPDLRFDVANQRVFIDRASYFDKKGKENNPVLGITYTDDDLLRFITNIYAVLLTRGIRGTFVYACDPALRDHLTKYIRPFEGTT